MGRPDLVRLQHLLAYVSFVWAVFVLMNARTEYKSCQARSQCPMAEQDPGLEISLVAELWTFPCRAAATTGKHESQGRGRTGWSRQQHLLAYLWTGSEGRLG